MAYQVSEDNGVHPYFYIKNNYLKCNNTLDKLRTLEDQTFAQIKI